MFEAFKISLIAEILITTFHDSYVTVYNYFNYVVFTIDLIMHLLAIVSISSRKVSSNLIVNVKTTWLLTYNQMVQQQRC